MGIIPQKSLYRAIIIDGFSLIYKAYYAAAGDRQNSDQQIINDTISIIKKSLNFFLSQRKFDFSVVAIDSGKETFRKKQFAGYKAQRPSMPENLRNSLRKIDDVFRQTYGLTCMTSPLNYEADDLIASLSKKFSAQEVKVDIFSTDKDLLQLVDHFTSVHLIKKGLGNVESHCHYNFKKLNDNLLPYQIPLLKAIAGDSSDNYKGIPGLGESKASDLIVKYRTKDNLYKHLDELAPKTKLLLENHVTELDMFLTIARVVNDIELNHDIDYFAIRPTSR